MRRILWTLAATLALAACKDAPKGAAPAAPAPVDQMPDWKSAISHQVAFDAAAKTVKVQVKVAPGFHAYTVGETTGKPLKLDIAEDSDFALEGEVQYPKGTEKALPMGRSVIVEGTAEVSAQVAPKSETAKQVKGTFRYQVCTDEACDRPRTEPFTVPAS